MTKHKYFVIDGLPSGMEGWAQPTAGKWLWVVCGSGYSLSGKASSEKTCGREARLAAMTAIGGK